MLALALCAGLVCTAHAQKVYGPGVTDTTIKIGQTMPYSGPAASYGVLGRVEVALFEAINEQGGINGRKVTLLSFDDAYSPPKTSEQTRKLVEQEGVLGIFGTQGTPTAAAIQKYLAAKKMVFLSPSGASRLNDPASDPYMLPIYTSYRTEARVYGRYIAQTKPDAKIAVLYQNDDFGKDYLSGLKEGLGPKADTMIVKTASYEVSDPTIDSQLVSLKESGADVFVDIATPRAGIQAIRRTHEMAWQPLHISVHNCQYFRRAEASRARCGHRPRLRRRAARSERSRLGQRPAGARLSRVHGQAAPRRRSNEPHRDPRLHRGKHHGADPPPMR